MEIKELEKQLNLKFKRIWRCADSYKWNFLKNTELLSFDWLDKNIDYHSLKRKEIGRGANSIYPFVHLLQEGDLIFVMGKNSFQGIAICKSKYNVIGPFVIMGDSGEKPAVKVKYIFKLETSLNHNLKTHNNPSTFAEINQYNFSLEETLAFLKKSLPEAYNSLVKEVDPIDNVSENIRDKKDSLNNRFMPLNQILFGPPGTGKTYHTVNEALKIVGEEIEGKTREEIKVAFDAKVKEGQIVFTTFHQSMSYEDFIEGIKPIEPEKEEGQVIYRVEPGIFKKLCIEASFDIAKVGMSQETALALDFSNLYDLFIEEVEEKLSNQKDVMLKTKSEGTVLIDSISQPGNIIIKHPKGERTYTVSKARLTKLNSSIKDLDEVSNINDEFRSIIGGSNSSAYWAVLNGIRQITKRVAGKLEDKTYTYSDKVEVVNQMTKDDYKAIGSRRFVVIIDEINRGNVSQIFGELITLIEEDKRLGRDEALEVMLPYSKEKFGVPANLFIIGTMNTADRSVEALDTALRRRFSFTEMPPKYELDGLNYSFAGITGSELLKTINKRIEKLLDRDHLIGHSYFLMKDEDKTEPGEKLRNSFYRNIIPLLQEYFFGDYAKIGAVLGRGFVRSINGEENEDSFFSPFEGFEPSDYQDKISYQLIVYQDLNAKETIQTKDNSEEVDFKRAIEILMNR